ncbi:hypothetical protein Cabys_954 [Caldithrix abyssi DSM 13497]|uniref:Uncharacterized protein n=1 Tax=Caldithrix abyssi DSM 13497 TaxID=880073 RepID=A0A1J1C5X8_CALAY|nr:hypothetical protein Cabys_954 [Caldithrix abyssi DSM 13497]
MTAITSFPAFKFTFRESTCLLCNIPDFRGKRKTPFTCG